MQGSFNPSLPGLSPSDIVVLSEKLHTIGSAGFELYHRRCVTHFGDDAIPYHPGEGTCLSRCVAKVSDGFALAKASRSSFEESLKAMQFPYEWMRQLAEEGRAKP